MRQTAFLAAFLAIPAFLPAADPALMNMIMPDTKILAGVNVGKAETSPFGQFILRSMPPDQSFQQFVTTSGFDPRTDLSEILVATNAALKSGLVLARGKFNAAQIGSAAIGSGEFTSTVYNGAQLIAPKNAGEAMAILLDTTPATIAVMGDLASVKAAIDRHKGNNAVDSVLASKVASYGATDAWSVSIAPLSFGGATPKNSPLNTGIPGEFLKKVQASSGGITFSSPIQITGEAEANSPQDANALGDVIRFLASMMQGPVGDKAGPQIANLVQSLSVTTVQNTVKIALSIPESALESIVNDAVGHKPGII